jgi:hypothetical protein
MRQVFHKFGTGTGLLCFIGPRSVTRDGHRAAAYVAVAGTSAFWRGRAALWARWSSRGRALATLPSKVATLATVGDWIGSYPAGQQLFLVNARSSQRDKATPPKGGCRNVSKGRLDNVSNVVVCRFVATPRASCHPGRRSLGGKDGPSH